MKFNHIGLVVRDIEAAQGQLADSLQLSGWTEIITDEGIGVQASFGRDASGVCYELIAPYGEDSPIAGHLAQGRSILNHVAYTVGDITEAAAAMRRARAFPLGPAKPAVAFGGRPVQFFMSPLKFIIELVEGQEPPRT